MTIRETIKKGMINLKTNGIEEPNLKARLLMQFILNKPRQYLLIYDNQTLSLRQEVNYFKAIKKNNKWRTTSTYYAYARIYENEFLCWWKCINTKIRHWNISRRSYKYFKKINAKKILDLCTGSGAIAISLAKYIENSEITAVDISKKALEIARTNAKNNDVENQITFVESDLFKNLKEDKYDVIVSNPPYIKREVIKKLNKDVQKEPIIALDGGYDGLDFYRKIINESEKYLKFNGYLCFEIGYDQKEDVIGIIKNKERYINTYSKKDLYGNDRIIITKLS